MHTGFSQKNTLPRVRTVKTGGFTIIELLVAVSIFAIVMTTAVGTLIAVIRAGSSAQSSQALTTNLSFALDIMTRELRTGYRYYCDDDVESGDDLESGYLDCVNGASAVAVTDSETGYRVGYRLNGTAIEQRVDDVDGGITGSWIPITSSQVVIEDLQFIIEGSTPLESGDQVQPSIRVLLHGKATDTLTEESEFFIQSSVTSRTLDI